MPRQHWKHTCKKTGQTRSEWTPFRCWRCFRLAENDGSRCCQHR